MDLIHALLAFTNLVTIIALLACRTKYLRACEDRAEAEDELNNVLDQKNVAYVRIAKLERKLEHIRRNAI